MPAVIWCARARYEVELSVQEVAELLASAPGPLVFFDKADADCSPASQVAVNPAHVSAVEPLWKSRASVTSSFGSWVSTGGSSSGTY